MTDVTRAALYCRVSTDTQAQHGTSLADQQARCETYCDDHDWTVTGRFVDEGISGATLRRSALRTLLDSAADGDFDVVVVTDPDRLSRDLVDGLVLERQLERLGIRTVYLVDPDMGTLERQLRGVIAEEERRKLAERSARGRRAVVAAGNWPGGPPPYGYRIGTDHKGRRRLEINEIEASTLRFMIDAYLDQHHTTRQIATRLNERGTPTPAGARNTAGARTAWWNHRRVRAQLTAARAIAGTWTYHNGTESLTLAIPAIVSEARLNQLQQRLAATSSGPRSEQQHHFYLLTGRITSPCGSPMYGTTKADGTNRIYRCAASTTEPDPNGAAGHCDCVRVSATIVDDAVWAAVHDTLTHPEQLTTRSQPVTSGAAPGPNVKLRTLNRRINRVETALATTIADLLTQGLDASAIGQAAHHLESELAHLREDRARIIDTQPLHDTPPVRAEHQHRLAEAAKIDFTDPTNENRAAIIAALDTHIRIIHTPICPRCNGRGLIPTTSAPPTNRPHRTADICPTCRRHRTIPTITIHGHLPDTQTEHGPHGTPFNLTITPGHPPDTL